MESGWPDPTSVPALDGDAVHVWSASLDEPPIRIDSLAHLLSPLERDRAARFHRVADQHRSLARWGLLRILLGQYLAAAPASIPITRGPRGKPAIAPAH